MIMNQNVVTIQLDSILWLLILVGILVSIGIIVSIYKFIAYRRISIVSKKIDYLVEDLIYKTEYLTPAVESIVKLSNYIDIIEGVVKQNAESVLKYVTENKESAVNISKQLKEVIREKK